MKSILPPWKRITVVLALLLASVVPVHADDAPAVVEVPSVIGKDEAAAKALLDEQGLEADITYVADDVAPAGTVIGQEPKSGSEILRGARIALRIIQSADGAPIPQDPGADPAPLPDTLVVVPNLLGLRMHDAEAALAALALEPRATLVASPGRPAFEVVGQDLEAGSQVAPGTHVRFQVVEPAQPPALVAVPHLQGLTEAGAVQLLQGLGLPVRVVREVSPWPAGQVFAQSPVAGQEVAAATEILIRVALPQPEPLQVQVPNLSGRTYAQARLLLLSRGLQAHMDRKLYPNKNVDLVYGQSRPAGSLALPGTSVTVYLPKRAIVPNVLGKSKAQAQQILSAAGFQPKLYGPAGAGPTKVTVQNPGAGKRIARGSEVSANYVKTLILIKTTVPNVIGKSIQQAKDMLDAKGLKHSLAGPAGNFGLKVIKSQSIAAGTKVIIGTKVHLVYKLKPLVLTPLVTVPNVVGKTIQQAKQMLQAKGLSWTLAGPANGVGVKVIKSQSKAAGSKIAKGSKVGLVWKYKLIIVQPALKVTVPNVKNKPIGQAKAQLEALGLKVELIPGIGMRVKSQSINPGTKVFKGTTIKLKKKF